MPIAVVTERTRPVYQTIAALLACLFRLGRLSGWSIDDKGRLDYVSGLKGSLKISRVGYRGTEL